MRAAILDLHINPILLPLCRCPASNNTTDQQLPQRTTIIATWQKEIFSFILLLQSHHYNITILQLQLTFQLQLQVYNLNVLWTLNIFYFLIILGLKYVKSYIQKEKKYR